MFSAIYLFFLTVRRPPISTLTSPLFPDTTHFRASETCAIEGSANTTGTVPPPGAGHPAPEHVLAVTEDGRLVLLRTADGAEVSELADLGSGEATEDNPAPPPITGVAVRPGTSEVSVEPCCEPAAGHRLRVAQASTGADPGSGASGSG